MIKINLLPTKKRERRGINLDPYILVAALVISSALVGGFYLKNVRDIEQARKEIQSLKQQAMALEPIKREFAALEKDKQEVSNKLAVVNRMKEGRAVPPRMLYDLSSLVKDSLWLRRLKKDPYILVAALVISSALVGGFYLKNARDIEQARKEIQSLKQQAMALEPIKREFAALEKDKQEVSNKLAVINRMKEGRAVPPRMLYDLSSLVKDSLWLRRLKKDDKKLEIEGRSIDNESICDFVERLAKLPYLKDMELKSVEDVAEGGITVKKFVVDGSVSL